MHIWWGIHKFTMHITVWKLFSLLSGKNTSCPRVRWEEGLTFHYKGGQLLENPITRSRQVELEKGWLEKINSKIMVFKIKCAKWWKLFCYKGAGICLNLQCVSAISPVPIPSPPLFGVQCPLTFSLSCKVLYTVHIP